jgi:hypothetical protein
MACRHSAQLGGRPASAEPMLWRLTLLGTTEPSANSFIGQQRGIEGC